jgi:alkaline phosphatase D
MITAALLLSLALPQGLRPASVFRADLPRDVARTWIGPGFHGNRLQDWRLRAGRIECTRNEEARPCRVLHALTAAVASGGTSLRVGVTLGTVDPGALPGAAAWGGFLVGAGSPEIDHRLTALVHHRPAEDGGLIAAVDGDGRAVFRDFERNEKVGNWGVTGPLGEGEGLPVEGQERLGQGWGDERPDRVQLELSCRREADGWRLTLFARDPEDRELSRSTLTGVPDRLVDGSLALLSHGGPAESTNGYWFEGWTAAGDALELHPGRTFGPFWTAQYTLSRGVLKLTAQLPPLGAAFDGRGRLEFRHPDGEWRAAGEAELRRPSFTMHWRVERWGAEPWQRAERVPYRLRVTLPEGDEHTFEGAVRAEPEGELVLAAFTGNKHFTGGIRWNHDGVWFPHTDIVSAVAHHDPDLLFFSGDQIYEGDLTGAQRRPLGDALLDYHDKWLRWCWAFRDLVRDRPTICIPDDHDVYHGNIWGAGGRAAERQDDGGYTMPPEFVRMVEETQTSHLPDPFDPTPVEQGIGVYYTDLRYGGVSFAILEDRKWKSSATPLVPEAEVVNGWFQNEDFDPVTGSDVPGAVLLGERQLAFLRAWAGDWSGDAWMKVALSQTIFANVATLPAGARSGAVLPGLATPEPGEYPEGYHLAADCDSNGWPRSGRDRALRELRRAFAFHVAGDQHLGSLVRYGVDAHDDAGHALCVPSIANTWPRRWFPPEPGAGRDPAEPAYTGRFRDGFGNAITVLAVSNPVRSGVRPAPLHDRAPGYGIVRFERASRRIEVECWPRWSDPASPGAAQYPGWPRTVTQEEQYAREPLAHLAPLVVEGLAEPVVQLVHEPTGELVWARRLAEPRLRAPVFAEGPHTLRVGSGEPGAWRELTGLLPAPADAEPLVVRLGED